MANLNLTGPPGQRQSAMGPNVNRVGPPMNASALSKRRRGRLHRATPKRRMPAPSRPV